MPGYELLDKKEFSQISDVFLKSKTLFRMGFENQRKGIFKVKEFERNFANVTSSSLRLASANHGSF